MGWFHARHLQRFIPQSGTELARLQGELETCLQETGSLQQGHDLDEDGEDINREDTGGAVPLEDHATGTVAFEGGGRCSREIGGRGEQGRGARGPA